MKLRRNPIWRPGKARRRSRSLIQGLRSEASPKNHVEKTKPSASHCYSQRVAAVKGLELEPATISAAAGHFWANSDLICRFRMSLCM